MQRVFVYGTLLSGQVNNRLLKEANLLGKTKIGGYRMFSLGHFPACVRFENNEYQITGEVWEVNDDTFAKLDVLEGYPTLYNRTLIETEFGGAWIYNMLRIPEYAVEIKSGDFVKYNLQD